MIDKLINAVEEMKRITKCDYATAKIHVGSDHKVTYQVYTTETGCISHESLETLIEATKLLVSPDSLLAKAKQLRKQVEDLERKAQQQQTQESQ